MAYKHIITGTATSCSGACSKVKITVNAALTGSIIVSDETGTLGTPIVATITNPAVGSVYEYWDLKNGVCVTPSTTCDITVNTGGSFGYK